jgi:hypothetical protein
MMIDHTDNVIDLNALLHPGSVYDRPREVLRDTTLSIAEKHAILASWASDAAAVASNPAFRELPGSHRMVSIEEVLEALRELDDGPQGPPGGKPARVKSVSRVGLAAYSKGESASKSETNKSVARKSCQMPHADLAKITRDQVGCAFVGTPSSLAPRILALHVILRVEGLMRPLSDNTARRKPFLRN